MWKRIRSPKSPREETPRPENSDTGAETKAIDASDSNADGAPENSANDVEHREQVTQERNVHREDTGSASVEETRASTADSPQEANCPESPKVENLLSLEEQAVCDELEAQSRSKRSLSAAAEANPSRTQRAVSPRVDDLLTAEEQAACDDFDLAAEHESHKGAGRSPANSGRQETGAEGDAAVPGSANARKERPVQTRTKQTSGRTTAPDVAPATYARRGPDAKEVSSGREIAREAPVSLAKGYAKASIEVDYREGGRDERASCESGSIRLEPDAEKEDEDEIDPWSLEQFSPLPRAARPSHSEKLAQARLGDVQRRCEETVSQFSADIQNLSIELARCKQELVRERERKRDLERVRVQYEKDINALSRELRTMTLDIRNNAQRQQEMDERERVLRSLLAELGVKQVAGIRNVFRAQRDRIADLETSLRDTAQELEWTKQSHRHVQEQCHALDHELQSARKARWDADAKRIKIEEDREKEALAHRRCTLLCAQLRAQVAHLTAQLKLGAVSPRAGGESQARGSPKSSMSKTARSPTSTLPRPGPGSPLGSPTGSPLGSPHGSHARVSPRAPQLQNVIGAHSFSGNRKGPVGGHRPPYGGARRTTLRFA